MHFKPGAVKFKMAMLGCGLVNHRFCMHQKNNFPSDANLVRLDDFLSDAVIENTLPMGRLATFRV